MQEQLELLKEQVASLEVAVNNSDSNLFYQNIKAIKNSLANLEKNKTEIKKADNIVNVVIKDKKVLKQSTIKIRVVNRLKCIKRLSLASLKTLKSQLKLVKLNIKRAKLEMENKLLKKTKEAINNIQNKKYNLKSKGYLKSQLIKNKIQKQIHSLKHVSKNTLNLFKQQLSMRSNTVGFKNIVQNIQIGSLNAQNKVLESLNNVKQSGYQARINFINKKNLLKKKIKLRVINVNNKVKKVSSNIVEIVKDKIKDKYLDVTTNIGVRVLDAKDAIKDEIRYASTAAGVKAIDIMERIVDKKLLLQDRIKRKFSSAKNIITRKTGMQIALFKQDLKNKMKENSEKYMAKKEIITELKQQRNALVEQLLSSPLEQSRVR